MEFTYYDRPITFGSRQIAPVALNAGLSVEECHEGEYTGALSSFDYEEACAMCYPSREYPGPRPMALVPNQRHRWLSCAKVLPNLDFLATGDALTPEGRTFLARIGVHEPEGAEISRTAYWQPIVAKLVARMQEGIDNVRSPSGWER